MADSTVATMAAASTLDGTELYYGVQGGADKKVTGAQIKTLVSASPTLVTPALGTPASGVMTNVTGLPLTTGVTGTLPVANGGTGTTTPGLVAGTNVTVTGTWPNQTVNASGGGGGSPGGSTLQIQYNAAGSFAGMAGTSWDNTNQSLAISGATVTASKPILDLSQTWNNGAVVFTGLKANFTKTAGDNTSLLLDLQVGGSSKFNVDVLGNVHFGNTGRFITDTGSLLQIGGTGVWITGSMYVGSGADIVFSRVASGIAKITDGSTGAGVIQFQPVVVASLPSAATAGKGARAFVSDATAPSFGATVAGSGAVATPVYSDGTNWKVG
jgi:hypothetical protein